MSAETDRLIAEIRTDLTSVSGQANNGFQMQRFVEPLLVELEAEIEAIENPE